MPETPTPRLGLYRTKSDGSENVNVLTDLNNNLDKLDTYIGFVSVPNQAARLATTGFVGLAVRQTDTGGLYVLAALPASVAGNWTQLPIPGADFGRIGSGLAPAAGRQVHVSNGATAGTGAVLVETTATAPGNRALSVRGSGDTQDRFEMDYDGRMQWGPGGATAPDTNLYRSAANTLMTDDTFALSAGSKLDVGTWQTYTPALGGGLAAGNGVLSARYIYRHRREVTVNFLLTCGSTSAKGTTGTWTFSLPVAAVNVSSVGAFWINDSGAALRVGSAIVNGSSLIELYLPNSGAPVNGNALTGSFGSAVIRWSMSYEV